MGGGAWRRGGGDAHLAERLDAVPEGKVHDDPGEKEAEGELPADSPEVVDPLGDVEHEVAETQKRAIRN